MSGLTVQDRNQSGITATGGNAGLGRAGTNRDSHRPGKVQILSQECQKRGFNPQFTEWTTRDGGCMCSVDIHGVILYSSRSFASAVDAKQSLAGRAIGEVKKLPISSRVAPSVESAAIIGTPAKRDWIKKESQENQEYQQDRCHGQGKAQGHDDRYSHRLPPPFAPDTKPVAGPTRGYDYDYDMGDDEYAQGGSYYRGMSEVEAKREQTKNLILHIQALYDSGIDAPSSFVFTDELASRAFLEGFAIAGKLNLVARSHRDDSEQHVRPRSPHGGPSFDRLYYGQFQRRGGRDGGAGVAGGNRERSPPAPRGRIQREHRQRSPIRPRLSFDGTGHF